MSDQNILELKTPTAPSESIAESLYPRLPVSPPIPDDFRMKKIMDSQKELENEISSHKKTLKKYKRVHSIFIASSATAGTAAVLLSSSGLAVSLSGIGIIVGAPLAGVAGLLGLISASLTVGSKRLDKKIMKHEKTVSLAESSNTSIGRLISKALNDKQISDTEFNFILDEVKQYHTMKRGLRNKTQPSEFNIEELKEQIKNEYRKKLGSLVDIKN